MFENTPRRWICLRDGCSEYHVTGPGVDDATCPFCGSESKHVGYVSGQTAVMTGEPWDFVHDPADPRSTIPSMGRSVGRGPKEQQALYTKIIENQRKRAKQKSRDMGRRKEGELRMVGNVPRELFQARINQTGDKNYWFREGKAALRREGLSFED